MKHRALWAVAALFAANAWAADIRGSGHAATEQRAASGMHGVAMSIAGHLEVVQGDPERVTVTADDNVLPVIETVVEHGILEVRTREHTSVTLRTPLHVVVVAHRVEELTLSGSGTVDASRIDVSKLSLAISGSGQVQLSGSASSLRARISGQGRVDAAKLGSDDVDVSISGSGHLIVVARRKLEAKISGSGDVEYYGDPAVERRISGVGRVRRAGPAPG